jgi:membrane associated rhomboid family serine protease
MFILPLGDDVDHRDFPLTGVLMIVVNVMVFMYMLRLAFGSPDAEPIQQFVLTWGLVPAELGRGYIVGVVTHMFLHGDFFHILGNMLCLWAFIQTLEGCLGTARLIAFYLLWGVVGGLMHAAVNWGSDVPMIGASGAVAGMMGAYWVAFGPLTKIRTIVFVLWHGMRVDIPAGAFMAIWILLQLLGAAGESGDGAVGVAWFAHFGGFLAGAGTMLCLKDRTKARLVATEQGDLEFEPSAEEPTLADEPEYAPPPEAVPTICPYCDTPLDDANRLAPNLLRCPNPDCARCVYLEEAVAGP